MRTMNFSINENSSSFMSTDLNYVIYIGNKLDHWFLLLTVPLGILLNMISIFIFTRPNLNKTNMGFFYFHLSIWNTIVLIYYFFVMDSKSTLNYDLSTHSDMMCKLITFFRRFIREIPAWIDALITFDRYLTICHHATNRFKFMKRKSNIILIIYGIILLLALVSYENFFYYLNETSKKCVSTRTNAILSDIISISLRTVIPGFLMCLFSILLIKHVKRIRKNAKSISYQFFSSLSGSNSTSNTFRENQFTFSVLCMNGLFICLNTPVSIMYLIKHFYVTQNDGFVYELVTNIYLVTYNIANLYYSFMFFSLLAFNKLFRYEVIFLLKCLYNE